MKYKQSEHLAYLTIGWLGLVLVYDILVIAITMLDFLIFSMEHVATFLFQILIVLFIYELFILILIKYGRINTANT
jgi:hypothetical protein